MQVIEDRGVLVRVKKPEPIQHAIKQSKYIKDNGDGTHDVLVKWTLENVRRLANMGLYKTPSPILRDYDWPGALRPFEHQKTTASFLTANTRAFCFSEQGTAKTAATIWAADYLMSIGDIKKVLIIAPLSILHSAWMQDIFQVAMHRTAAIAHGSKTVRKKIIKGNYEFVIINYDGVKLVADDLKQAQFDLVVLDEANAVKTATTHRWKAINKVITPETKL